MKIIVTSGKRKTATAKAVVRPGAGIVRVNGHLLSTYEPELYRLKLQEPLLIAGDASSGVNIDVSVEGGGIASQTESCRLAIARALVATDKKLQKQFLDYDRTLLVADVRRKETHKPNCHGKARAKRQKSYR
ncbi:30S ribosomal protein S9 [Candidatus Woesearchaeota archaeon]|nr:30S ribosomal protein S9 [Candidatus Woesearchaeota archaeon]